MPRFGDALSVAAGLALKNDGLVKYSQLLSDGLTKWNISSLADQGAIHGVVPGIYLVGLARLEQRQLWRCAEMIGGADGVLTARSTFEVRGAIRPQAGVATLGTTRRKLGLEVVPRVPMATGRAGLIRIVPGTVAAPCEQVEGLRVATVPRGLVDFAAGPDGHQLGWLWRKAEYRGLLDHAAVEAELDDARRKGAGAVREFADAQRILTGKDTRLRSPKELDVLHLIAEAGLPLPEENVPVAIDGRVYIVDFLWRELWLILELDSPDHLKPAAGAADRERDQRLFVAGYDVQRYLDTAALADPHAFTSWLGLALGRQRDRASSAC